MNSEPTIRKFFLCHSSQDKPKVKKIASILEKLGVFVWYDDWNLKCADSIVNKINEALDSSTDLIVFLSAAAISSHWVQRELNSTLMSQLANQQIRVLLVKLEECKVPRLLQDLKWIKLIKSEGYPAGLKMMLEYCLPQSQAEAAINRLGEFIPDLIHSNQITDSQEQEIFVCPTCQRDALVTYTRKLSTDGGYEYEKGIQCKNCGTLYRAIKGRKCPKCNSVMLWRSQGSSEGSYGKYEEDFAWECPKCEETDWSA